MLLVYCILIIVSVCVTIVSTYFLLNSEDYRWQWVSFLSSASTAFYVFLYSVYYFMAKVNARMHVCMCVCAYDGVRVCVSRLPLAVGFVLLLASTAFYVFLYYVYYFIAKVNACVCICECIYVCPCVQWVSFLMHGWVYA